jgi:RHS repeat-associated protein
MGTRTFSVKSPVRCAIAVVVVLCLLVQMAMPGNYVYALGSGGLAGATTLPSSVHNSVVDTNHVLHPTTTASAGGSSANTLYPKPEVSLEVSDDTLSLGESTTISASATTSSPLSNFEVTVDGVAITLTGGSASYTPTTPGLYPVVATASDIHGNKTVAKAQFAVFDPSKTGSVSASLSDLGGQNITAPINIVGSVSNTNIAYYTLAYAKASITKFNGTTPDDESEPAPSDYVVFATGTSSNQTILGSFDPTLLENGYYRIKLTVCGLAATTSYTTLVQVSGAMKIGNFTTQALDITIPVFNFPLSVVREYDSRKKDVKGDFGYGWELTLDKATLSENGTPGMNWATTRQGLFAYKVTESQPHQIVIDWGNGKTEHFNYSISGSGQMSSTTQYDLTMNYTSVENTGNTLKALPRSDLLTYMGNKLLDINALDYYNPSRYSLTRPDGSVFIFSDSTGVESIQLPSGESIALSTNAITHSGGQSIALVRDSQNRITAIQVSDGREVSYTYDAAGNLVEVTDPSGEITTLVYDSEHYLTDVIDTRGVHTTQNIYDDAGRLIAFRDAAGNEISYEHDLYGRQDVITDRLGNTTVYTYDTKGNVTAVVDALGNSTTYTYDANNFKASRTDALGNTTYFSYNAYGDLLWVTDAVGHTATNSYDNKHQLTAITTLDATQLAVAYNSAGLVTSMTDARGNPESFAYNASGQPTSITDTIGTIALLSYNTEGKVLSSTNGAGESASFTYDTYGRAASRTVIKDSTSATEYYTYDVAGNLAQIIYADGGIINMEYDSAGFLVAQSDSLNRRTEFVRDAFGNITQIDYADATSETFVYDAEGNNIAATNRLGLSVVMEYDAVGNLIAKTYPNGAEETYAYDALYRLTQVKSPSGAITTYAYDELGRATTVTDALGGQFSYSYNAQGLLASYSDALDNTTTYSYDAGGLRTQITFADLTTITATYDARGRITSETDQDNNTTTYAYDGADRLIKVTDALLGEWAYGYDSTGNLVAVTDPLNNTTTYAYDTCGRVVEVTNALDASSQYTYDTEGNTLSYTNFDGVTRYCTYDENGKVVERAAGAISQAFTYTATGQLASVTEASATTTYSYDVVSGLASINFPSGSELIYNYDNAMRLVGVALNVGSAHYETSYEYDLGDRLVQVIGYDGIEAHYSYDANGNRIAATFSNGTSVAYSYDSLNRLVQETLSDSSGTLAHYDYTLGSRGERLAIAESDDGLAADRTVAYTYDELLRLVSETVAVGGVSETTTYAYDSASNRTTKTSGGTATAYSYNALNQLVSETTAAATTSYSYNANGNVVEKDDGTTQVSYIWDALGRLDEVTTQSGQDVSTESYGYDYAGNRTTKTNAEGTIGYVVDPNAELPYVLAETDDDGDVITYYSAADELIALSRADETRYYHFDGHGDTRLLTDENAVITDTWAYDAFGAITTHTGTTSNDFLYTGQQYDEESGLYYLRARYMNPQSGLFMSQDPYRGSVTEPLSLHKYLYANANPALYTDPTGLHTIAELNTTFALMAKLSALALVSYAGYLAYITHPTASEEAGSLLSQTYSDVALLSEAIATGVLRGQDAIDQVRYQTLLAAIAILMDKLKVEIAAGAKDQSQGDDIYTVYYVKDPNDQSDDKRVIYIGMTKNIGQRRDAHRQLPGREKWDLTPYQTGLTKEEARIWEQLLIATYTLERLDNKINSVAPKKIGLSKFAQAIADITSLEESVREDEVYHLLGGI